MHDLDAGKRAEVLASVADELAGGENAGKALLLDDDERVRFIVLELDVVKRLVLFDEAVFQQQRIGFRGRDEPLDVMDLGNEEPGLAVVVVLGEVAGDAFLQVFGLAHIKKAAVHIEVLVDARLLGKARQGLLDVFGFCHG